MKKPGTKDRLLDATLKLISERGYLGATTREIAQEAGVTELTLFRHFGSKEKLFEALLKRYTFLPRLKELLPELSDMPYQDALILVATRFLQTLKERKCMVRIMSSEINRYPGKIRKIHRRFVEDVIDTLASYFHTLQKRRVLRGVPPEMAARMFLAVFYQYFNFFELMQGENLTEERVRRDVETFVDIFVNGTMHT